MLDSHQHFWRLDRGDYAWMGPQVGSIYRDFLPEDLRPLIAAAGVTRTIVVQAADTEAEAEFLLDLAERTDFIAGVVGWLDLDCDGFAARLARYRGNPLFVGVRPMLQDLPDDDWILRPRVLNSLSAMAEAGTPLDILTFTRHLPHVAEALNRTPGLRAVVDHLSKPEVASGTLDPWRGWIGTIARFPTVWCKVSGLFTEAGPGWTPDGLRPYVDHIVEVFGADRLIFGSDWPVCTLAASYASVFDVTRSLLAERCGAGDLEKIFSRNGAAFYDL